MLLSRTFQWMCNCGVKVWTLAMAPLTWVRLVISSALHSQKSKLIGMCQWCCSALCGHPLPTLTDSWTHGAASRHTIASISHTRPSPHSRSYYSFPVLLRVGCWVGLSTQWVSNLLKVACSLLGVSRTRNLSVTSPDTLPTGPLYIQNCSGKETEKKWVFSRDAKTWREGAEVTCCGRLFQTRAVLITNSNFRGITRLDKLTHRQTSCCAFCLFKSERIRTTTTTTSPSHTAGHLAVMQCLSAHPSCSYILSKRIKISSKFFHRRVAKPF